MQLSVDLQYICLWVMCGVARKLFSWKKRRLILALLSYKFGYCHSWTDNIIDTTAYYMGQYEPSSPSTKELNGVAIDIVVYPYTECMINKSPDESNTLGWC